MKIKACLLLLSFWGVTQHAHALERVLVQSPAVFDPQAPIVGKVKEECAVDSLLGNHVLQQVGLRYPGTLTVADATVTELDRVLHLTILSVTGIGGGGWTGPKSVTVRVDLKQNGRVLGSTVLKRASRGGAFGGMIGTCAIIEKCTEAIAKDLGKWLAIANPTSSVTAEAAIGAAQAKTEETPNQTPR